MTKEKRTLIYENNLASMEDIRGFQLEGQAKISFPNGRMRMENSLDESLGQMANYVFWCPEEFPGDIQVEWDFWPVKEPGLSMMFFAAAGMNGEDLFDPILNERYGQYEQYTHGDIRTLHIAYFRRRYPEERSFHLCNLRKSSGFHLVAQGADPIPNVEDCMPPYHLMLRKQGAKVHFAINELPILEWEDDGRTFGPILGSGKIGFRQMAPLIAEYANLQVYRLDEDGTTRKI
ncbi:DUF1961 family protein [Paenibacillus qinlingensis]|uniref:DUF1961 family protein n=1 Tax=Paenibacillus qinlingensis TaxID=1837343 RepID=UPI00156330C4|nr:DUF1961 family protein [Paenibacillus qinlingensis]NQX58807.1 DUF1961 family protein [Paenibacillus qinlingensis]